MKKDKDEFDKLEDLAGNLKYSKDFQTLVKKLRNKWDIKPGGWDKLSDFVKWRKRLFSIEDNLKGKSGNPEGQQFENDIVELLRDSGLNPALTSDFIWFYLPMSDELLKKEGLLPKNPLRLSMEIGNLGIKLVVHNLHPFTSKEDWAAFWPKVEEMKKVVFAKKWTGAARRYRKMFNEEIAQFIFEERNKDKKFPEITEAVKNKFGNSSVSGDTDTSKMLQRFSHKVKKDTLG